MFIIFILVQVWAIHYSKPLNFFLLPCLEIELKFHYILPLRIECCNLRFYFKNSSRENSVLPVSKLVSKSLKSTYKSK